MPEAGRMEINEIKMLIEQGLPGARVEIEGDGRHFSAIVISEEFAEKNLVQQHQLVYKALGGRVGTDIHALTIKTWTPGQWEQQKDLRVI